MREDWEMKKLGDVCDLQNGYAFRSKWYVESSNTLNIRMSNIRPDGSFDPDHNIRYLPDDLAEEYSKYILEEGDLVIAMTDMANDPKILGLPTLVKNLKGRKFLLNQRVGKLKDFSDDIYVPYLRYYLSSPVIKEYYKSKGAGGLQINIGKKDILTAEIPIPPLPEQKQIVEILGEAFAALDRAKANIEQNIQNAEELFQSKLNGIFSERGEGWETFQVKGLGDVITGTTPPTKDKSNYGDYIPFVKPGHFQPDGSLNSEDSMLSKKGLDNGRLIQEKSVLMVCIGASIGKTGYTDNPVSSNQQINAVTPNEDFNSKLIYYGMISKNFLNQVFLNASQTTLPIINKTKWSNLTLNLPVNKNEQRKIIFNLDDIRAETISLLNSYRSKIESLEQLKKSILQQAFSGQLTGEGDHRVVAGSSS
jgi:type I restriction enzyme S subunit